MEQDPQHRSLLGAALNIEYGPCSVAAAELSRSANSYADIYWNERQEIIEQKRRNSYGRAEGGEYEHKIVVNGGSIPETKTVAPRGLTNSYEEPDRYSGSRIQHKQIGVALVQDMLVDTKTIMKPTRVKKRFRTIEEEVEKEVTTISRGDIWLADRVLGGNILMPVASFQERVDGNCSYVQIGPEINDDSIFAVQSDEQTKRLELIDAIRKLLPREGEPELTDTAKSYFYDLREQNANQLSVAIGGFLNDKISDHLNGGNGKYLSLSVVESEGQVTYYDIATQYNNRYQVAEEGQNINVYKVGEGAGARLIFGAIERGNVMFPILETMLDTGEHSFVSEMKLDDIDKYRTMMAFVRLFFGEQYGSDEEFANALGDHSKSPGKFLMKTFDIDRIIQSQLKPECEQQERLATALGKKALELTYSGTVHDVNMNTTLASVSGNVVVQRVGDIFQARVVAKPDALKGTLPNEIASFVYSPTEPLEDRLPKEQDAEEFASLIEGFHQTV